MVRRWYMGCGHVVLYPINGLTRILNTVYQTFNQGTYGYGVGHAYLVPSNRRFNPKTDRFHHDFRGRRSPTLRPHLFAPYSWVGLPLVLKPESLFETASQGWSPSPSQPGAERPHAKFQGYLLFVLQALHRFCAFGTRTCPRRKCSGWICGCGGSVKDVAQNGGMQQLLSTESSWKLSDAECFSHVNFRESSMAVENPLWKRVLLGKSPINGRVLIILIGKSPISMVHFPASHVWWKRRVDLQSPSKKLLRGFSADGSSGYHSAGQAVAWLMRNWQECLKYRSCWYSHAIGTIPHASPHSSPFLWLGKSIKNWWAVYDIAIITHITVTDMLQ